jgi:hypothetical protein
MRRFLISLVIFGVFSCQTGQILAASIKTYAHANIVPGADALLDHLPGAETSRFALSGSAMNDVSVQITTPGVGTDTNSFHSVNQGMLSFEYPLTEQNPVAQSSQERIITIVFE